MSVAARLREHVMQAVGAPVEVSIGVLGNPATVRVTPPSDAASLAVQAFDWSDSAQVAWKESQQPERKTLRDAAAQAIADNQAFLSDGTVTQAEAVAQLKSLTRQVNRIIALLAKD